MENTQMSEADRQRMGDFARETIRLMFLGRESDHAHDVLRLLAELERVEVVASEALSNLSRLANARGLHADEYRSLAKDAVESHRESSGKALEIAVSYQRRADEAEAALAREREKTASLIGAAKALLLDEILVDDEWPDWSDEEADSLLTIAQAELFKAIEAERVSL